MGSGWDCVFPEDTLKPRPGWPKGWNVLPFYELRSFYSLRQQGSQGNESALSPFFFKVTEEIKGLAGNFIQEKKKKKKKNRSSKESEKAAGKTKQTLSLHPVHSACLMDQPHSQTVTFCPKSPYNPHNSPGAPPNLDALPSP